MKPKKVERDLLEKSEGVMISEVERSLRNAEENFQYGLQLHQIMESVPAPEDLEEGQLVLGKDGTTWKVFTKIQDTLYEVALTATS